MTMLEQGQVESKKKIGGKHAFYRDNQAEIILKVIKYRAMYGFFSTLKLYYSKKCMVTPNFLFGY